MAKYLITILVAISVFSGNCQKNSTKPPHHDNQIILIDNNTYNLWPDDSFHISPEVSIIDDSLKLIIGYSGGCADHTFRLIALRSFMESYPVAASVFLSHNAHGDMCQAYFTENLSFDLRPLKELYRNYYGEAGDTLYLSIDGLEQPVVYEMGPN
ncbi:MAG: hypothetical protein GY839_20360 [candidate division Zixibacteria bacterium]|nr:hypothetical protein [candidate division Zixibacteria bacterium]